MTRTHATGSAFSYGKRYLLIGMFNLAIGDDDDGNAAGRRGPPPIRRDVRPMDQPHGHWAGDEQIDPQTGEVHEHEHVDPFTIEMTTGSTWAQFLEPLQRNIMAARTIAEVDQWKLLNQDLLLKLKEAKPALHQLFEKNIQPKVMQLEQVG
jgi:hypothetical protein